MAAEVEEPAVTEEENKLKENLRNLVTDRKSMAQLISFTTVNKEMITAKTQAEAGHARQVEQ